MNNPPRHGSNGSIPFVSIPDPERPNTWLDALTPEAEILRDYQRSLLAETAKAMRQYRRICLQAPTGAGKTVIIGALVAAAIAKGLRVLILATRTRLVRQLHERMDGYGIPHGILAASMPGYVNWGKPAQIASVDTLYRRCFGNRTMPMPLADVVVFDECHLALGRTRQKILNAYPAAWIFGFTATPAKTSGAPLRDQFEKLILGPAVPELIGSGNLVKPRVFSKAIMTEAELTRVGTDAKTGDYKTGKLSGLMSRPKLIGDVVQNWLRIANEKRTLVFACDKAHGALLVEEFSRAGVACEQLTDSDDEATREEVISRLERGRTKVVVNCFLLSYGIDIPAVECVVLARPTRSVVLYLQAVGRGMRPSPGKDHMILIDHGRVVENLGPPAYDREWSLDEQDLNKRTMEKLAKDRKQGTETSRTCKECACTWLVSEEGNKCPSCGWQFVPKGKPVQVQQAELAANEFAETDFQVLETWHRQFIGCYVDRWPDRWQAKNNSGRYWAWVQVIEKFKRPADERMPSKFWQHTPAPPSDEVSGWVKHKMIAYAKSKRAAA